MARFVTAMMLALVSALFGFFLAQTYFRDYKITLAARESWLRKSGQCDKWNFCLTAGNMSPLNRRDHEQTSTAEPHISLQG